ncbi:MAG TPA: DUF1684 domain-containing protein [Acidimicrobiales bacterium]|nr:DUF1684 domain-containing protein [Acidimicrobiales bacterium]
MASGPQPAVQPPSPVAAACGRPSRIRGAALLRLRPLVRRRRRVGHRGRGCRLRRGHVDRRGRAVPPLRPGRAALGRAGRVLAGLEGYGGGLFLPFRDATAGDTTYGGGRYLLDTVKGADLGSTGSGDLVLDFNFAYHPSCAHDPRWSCPLAPPGSRLDVRMEAGERL